MSICAALVLVFVFVLTCYAPRLEVTSATEDKLIERMTDEQEAGLRFVLEDKRRHKQLRRFPPSPCRQEIYGDHVAHLSLVYDPEELF